MDLVCVACVPWCYPVTCASLPYYLLTWLSFVYCCITQPIITPRPSQQTCWCILWWTSGQDNRHSQHYPTPVCTPDLWLIIVMPTPLLAYPHSLLPHITQLWLLLFFPIVFGQLFDLTDFVYYCSIIVGLDTHTCWCYSGDQAIALPTLLLNGRYYRLNWLLLFLVNPQGRLCSRAFPVLIIPRYSQPVMTFIIAAIIGIFTFQTLPYTYAAKMKSTFFYLWYLLYAVAVMPYYALHALWKLVRRWCSVGIVVARQVGTLPLFAVALLPDLPVRTVIGELPSSGWWPRRIYYYRLPGASSPVHHWGYYML